ncbi:alkylmercury lyase [Halobacteriales archaeon QH_7_69_31]|nr:MAG: alkylmercury lyase [Halobacteriales archaeon QH_7_69_31]
MTNPDGADVEADDTTRTNACGCGSGIEPDGVGDAGTGRWLDTEEPLEVPLPADLGAPLGRLIGEPPVETIAEWLAAVRRLTDGGGIGIEHLCHADGETPHRGRMDGETYYFQCFYDAVALAALADEPVEVRTESPAGAEIKAHATAEELRVTPDGAVFSFGVERDTAPPDGDPTVADVYDAVCPYVRAFPDRAAYERWAEEVSAATVGLPLAGATDIAAALAE